MVKLNFGYRIKFIYTQQRGVDSIGVNSCPENDMAMPDCVGKGDSAVHFEEESTNSIDYSSQDH